eukprot:CAMPEP_0201554628 /NCGR_PEP_ID=MMETSP0173_2-20130828/42776_1 /ASSEMBLY_ACC=CAM_ASM_000268 /TAXON_ID=218659 /ORGANISM="Vexillifera sp., Strain DIVA3 564/2" /LENGTH=303 /DNA_ID=CAMNT_0047965995 /DNA_START=119 /DNA_END=1027 /DNA_ORIENTATION=-
MDWDVDELRKLTCNLNFVKNGKVCFSSTSWFPETGVLTACKPGCFAVSLNYRKLDHAIAHNALCLFRSNTTPIALVIRYVLDHANSFDQAVAMLSNAKTMAPCYIILSGAKTGEGVILSRCRNGVERSLNLSTFDGHLVQTNCDFWCTAIEKSWAEDDLLLQNAIERRIKATALINRYLDEKASQQPFEPHTLLKDVLSVAPVCNVETIFSVVMCAARSLYYAQYLASNVDYIEANPRNNVTLLNYQRQRGAKVPFIWRKLTPLLVGLLGVIALMVYYFEIPECVWIRNVFLIVIGFLIGLCI